MSPQAGPALGVGRRCPTLGRLAEVAIITWFQELKADGLGVAAGEGGGIGNPLLRLGMYLSVQCMAPSWWWGTPWHSWGVPFIACVSFAGAPFRILHDTQPK